MLDNLTNGSTSTTSYCNRPHTPFNFANNEEEEEEEDIEVAAALQKNRRYSTSTKSNCTSDVSSLSGFVTDFEDSEGLLREHGVRTDDDKYSIKSKRRRRRGHGWSRPKGWSRNRSMSPYTIASRTSRKTAASTISRLEENRAKKQIKFAEANSKRLKNMCSDFFTKEDNLSQFTTAYLLREKNCFEFYRDREESPMPESIIKTRQATKLREEVMTAFNRNVFQCPICLHCAFNEAERVRHMSVTHKSMPLYICYECEEKFILEEHYETHKERHNRNFRACCLFCSQEFTHRKAYEAHMDLYLTSSYKCIYCGSLYLMKSSYQYHVKERHPGLKFYIKKSFPSILNRIDSLKTSCSNTQNGNEFSVRVLIQTAPRSSRNNSVRSSLSSNSNELR